MTTASHPSLPLARVAAAQPWIFGPTADFALFGGSALASFALLGVGAGLGLLYGDTPDWVFFGCIVAIDVAHVWSTGYRVYFDRAELARRRGLYLGVPIVCYLAGTLLHAFGPGVFWRALAYTAVFHFVRQQYGWVALYNRRASDVTRLDRAIDTFVIYTGTVFPLVYWHGHLPRAFSWFVEGDFVRVPAFEVSEALLPVYYGVFFLYLARQAFLHATGRPIVWGKLLVMVTTWACWWAGIIALDSDYAFTVTNVLIHGVPYLALTYRYARARAPRGNEPGRPLIRSGPGRVAVRFGFPVFLATVLVLALAEEALWDRLVFHDRPWAFGEGVSMSSVALALLVPLLALPQAVHYVLDGFIWRTRGGKNPALID